MMGQDVVLNAFGFHEIRDKPTPEALKQHYRDKYYQSPSLNKHKHTYSRPELDHIRAKLEQKLLVLDDLRKGLPPGSFLDIGAGEGWALAFFNERGWEPVGLDYSDFGCASQNPQVLDRLIVGDIYESLAQLGRAGRRFDVLLLDNVLEHVLEPLALMRQLAGLTKPGGILVVEVPNDFSRLQLELLEQGRISRPFWIAPPDHLSYFNREGLVNLAAAAGWLVDDIMADYPIDFHLLNPRTNYVENPETGKACHEARVCTENLLHAISPEKTNELYRVLANMGLGRQIIGFFRRSSSGG